METITIGSDPEFAVLKNGRMIAPYDIWEPYIKKICGSKYNTRACNSGCRVENPFCGINFSPQIGSDCGAGELRPKPGNTPLEHRDQYYKFI